MRVSGITCAVILWVFGVSPTAAQQERTWRTTHGLARCLQTSDRPICILRALSFPNTSLADDPEFVNAPNVVRAVEGESPTVLQHDAYDRADRLPRLAVSQAVRAAIEADARGAAPEEALRVLRGIARNLPARSFGFGQIVTPNGAGHRVSGYYQIWTLFVGEDDSSDGYQGLPRPSEALARAALAAWAHEAPEVRGNEFLPGAADLALAFERFGDTSGVDRAIAIDPSIGPTFLLRRALSSGDLNAATRLAGSYAGPDLNGQLFARAAQQTLDALVAARRFSDARLLLESLQARAHLSSFASAALRRFVVALPHQEALGFLEDLDRMARAGVDESNASAAVRAVTGWMALGRAERAEALLALWLPRAEAQRARLSCGGGADFCLTSYIGEMYRRLDRLNELTAQSYVDIRNVLLFDREDGLGVSRLDERLAARPSDYRSYYALEDCVQAYSTQHDWERARYCLDRLLITGGSRPLSEHEQRANAGSYGNPVGGPYRAASAAMILSGAAARAGHWEVADPALQTALELLRDVPNGSIESSAAVYLRYYAVAKLQDQGRM